MSRAGGFWMCSVRSRKPDSSKSTRKPFGGRSRSEASTAPNVPAPMTMTSGARTIEPKLISRPPGRLAGRAARTARLPGP